MKLREFQQWLQSNHIPLAIFLNTGFAKQDPTIQYFSGTQSEYGILAIPAAETPTFYVPTFEVERLREKSSILVRPMNGLAKTLKNVLGKTRRVGINSTMLSLAERRLIKRPVVAVEKKVLELRSTKTEKEIAYLRHAATFAGRILEKTIQNWKCFRTEQDVYHFLLAETMQQGLEPSFSPIVASGTHGSKPHHEATKHKLHKGFCVLDFGVKYRGYCSDITRTVYVGTPTAKEKAMYELVLRAQEEGIAAVKPGVRCKDLYKAAANALGTQKKYFTHGLGHGIGVEIHEAPAISLTSKERLKEGMTITIEPGIYPKGFGIRIEDDVVVTKQGSRTITKIKKDLLRVG